MVFALWIHVHLDHPKQLHGRGVQQRGQHAAVTVSNNTTPAPANPAPDSGSGRGGGGAPSFAYLGALALLGLFRKALKKKPQA